MEKELICPCCEKHNFSVSNNYEVCPICKWRDDLLQRTEPDVSGGANKLSLNQYRLKWEAEEANQTLTQISNKYPDIKEDLDKVKQILSSLALKEAVTN
jgi:hypothetical protein